MKINDLEIRNISTEIRAVNTESRKISGLVIPVESRSELLKANNSKLLNGVLYFYETISRNAVTEDLINSMDVKLYVNHDPSQGTFARSKYGKGSLRLFITERGLEFDTELPKTAFGDMIMEGILRGDFDAMSFAFVPDLEDWTENEDGTYERTIRSIALLEECSILSCTPAYSATEVNTRSLENFKEQRKQEQEIRKQTILSKMDAKLQEIEEATKNII